MKFLSGLVAPIVDLWKNRSLLILLVIFVVSLGFAIAHNSAQLEAVAAAAGGALVGLLAPSPGAPPHRDKRTIPSTEHPYPTAEGPP